MNLFNRVENCRHGHIFGLMCSLNIYVSKDVGCKYAEVDKGQRLCINAYDNCGEYEQVNTLLCADVSCSSACYRAKCFDSDVSHTLSHTR